MHPLLGDLAGRACVYIFRLAYKPHSVRRLIPVYAKGFIPEARLCDHLSEQPTRD
jgi:hypothetical protein